MFFKKKWNMADLMIYGFIYYHFGWLKIQSVFTLFFLVARNHVNSCFYKKNGDNNVGSISNYSINYAIFGHFNYFKGAVPSKNFENFDTHSFFWNSFHHN